MVEAFSVAAMPLGRTPLTAGSAAAVVGAGMIGLLVVQVLRVAGCGEIMAIDLDAGRLEMARRLGATTVLKADAAEVPESVRRLTGGRGVDAAFEVVGVSPAVDTAVACVRKGGSVTLVGNLEARVGLPLQAVVTRQVTLIGTCASAGEYPACLDLIASGKVNVTDFISATPPLGEGALWFERLYAREKGLIKVILKP